MAKVLGVDVGGTGIKGAVVDTEKGKLVTERLRVPTPESGKPKAIIKVIDEIVDAFDWRSKPLGMGFPAIIKKGRSLSAVNVHNDWIGYPIKKAVEKKTACPISVINDADAAGLAEMEFGRAKGQKGTVLLLTLGTGIGSALFINGHLVPNTEFGHLLYKKGIAENYASNKARLKKNLSWEAFGRELNELLKHIDFILNPDLVLLGGGISKKFELYKDHIAKELNVEAAKNLNNAGIIGAALANKL